MSKNRFKVTIALISKWGLISGSLGNNSKIRSIDFYISNRSQLVASALSKLSQSGVKLEGFLNEYLIRQKNGLIGNLDEINAWLQKENNAWLSKDGTSEWGWEEVPFMDSGCRRAIRLILKPRALVQLKHALSFHEPRNIPLTSDQPVVDVILMPMGAARSRIASIPN